MQPGGVEPRHCCTSIEHSGKHRSHAGPCLLCSQYYARWLGGGIILSLQSPMQISRAEEAITGVIGYPKNVPGLVHIEWGDGGQNSCGWVSSDCTVVISPHNYVTWFADHSRDLDDVCITCGDHILTVTPSRPTCCRCFLQEVCPIFQVHLPGLFCGHSKRSQHCEASIRRLVISLPSISQCELSRSLDCWLCLSCISEAKEEMDDKGERL